MQNECNDGHLRIGELDESTCRTDGTQSVESDFFNHRTGAKWAESKSTVHSYKYSTGSVEVVYLSRIRSRRQYIHEQARFPAA